MSFLQFSLNDLKVINELISKFIWAGGKPKIKLDVYNNQQVKVDGQCHIFNCMLGQYKRK